MPRSRRPVRAHSGRESARRAPDLLGPQQLDGLVARIAAEEPERQQALATPDRLGVIEGRGLAGGIALTSRGPVSVFEEDIAAARRLRVEGPVVGPLYT